jgi:hypothetical protein
MFLTKLFCDTQEINKLLIKESYTDYKSLISNFAKRNPNYQGSVTCHDYNNFDEEIRNEYIQYQIQVENLKQIIINNLLNYCKNYPSEKISKNRFIHEYKEYPRRLEQNITEVLLDL